MEHYVSLYTLEDPLGYSWKFWRSRRECTPKWWSRTGMTMMSVTSALTIWRGLKLLLLFFLCLLSFAGYVLDGSAELFYHYLLLTSLFHFSLSFGYFLFRPCSVA